jgi:YfiH family protein
MLERRMAANGVVFYASPLLEAAGVPHAFSTRIGGLSPAPFDSLNLGNPSGCDITDDYERIWKNSRLLAAACGCPAGDSVLRVHQVHGGVVARAVADRPFDTHSKADAIVSDDPHRIASVRVADCVPVLLARPDGKTVAAVHAGWRGVIAGIVTAALRELLNPDGQAATVLAAIGPCIGYDAFEVGPEVLEEFRNHFGKHAPLRTVEGGKGFVDLRAAIRLQLLMAGVADERIDKTDRCTYRDREQFYSHRRDHGATGRMAAIISARA